MSEERVRYEVDRVGRTEEERALLRRDMHRRTSGYRVTDTHEDFVKAKEWALSHKRIPITIESAIQWYREAKGIRDTWKEYREAQDAMRLSRMALGGNQ